MKVSRKTKQKELIMAEIEKFNNFFSAEELYENVNKVDDKIGVATIYRVLKDLKEEHKIHSFICDRKNIYSKDNLIHAHFSCVICGEQSHFKIDNIDFIKKNLKSKVCHMSIHVDGTCEKCLKKD